MSFGEFEYQETTSNTLARILKGMRQEQIILDAVQNPIDDVEEYPDARQVESVKGTKDHIGAVTIPLGKNWHYANEPNDTTKVWLWFREGWRLKDLSRHGNQAFADQLEPAPYEVENYVPLRRKKVDDGTTSGRLYGIIDGKSQYYRVIDGPENRITDLLVTNTDICFSVCFSPWQTYIFDDDDTATVCQKLDDDQSNNAIRVRVEADGTVQFHLMYQGIYYNVETAPGVVPILETPEFIPGQFIDEEFLTNSTTKPWQWNPDVEATDWTWLFFSFNKTTKQLRIFKVADGGFAATQLVVSPTDQTGFISNTIAAYLPLNEGTGALQFSDATLNGNHATIGAAPNNDITWTNPSANVNIPRWDTDTSKATIPNAPTINNFTGSWTIAFKIRLQAYASTSSIDVILGKGLHATLAGLALDGFMFYMSGSGSHDLSFDFQSSTDYKFTGVTNGIAALNTWYDVIAWYDGSALNLKVGAVSATPVSTSGHTINSTGDWTLGHPNGHSPRMELSHVIIDKGTAWNATQRSWFASLTPGARTPVFPAWQPPKPPEPETPLPVVRPVEKVYELVLPDAVTTRQLNAPASATPFVSEFNVPGGTPSTIPEELKYDVADGTTGGGGTVPISTIYNLAAASSTGSITDADTGYIQRIVDTSSVLYNKKPTDLQFWVNDSGGDADGMVYPAIIRTNGTYTKLGAGISATGLTSTWTSISGVSYVDRTALAVGDGVGIVREGHSNGTVGVRRGGSNTHYDNAGGTVHSYQHKLVGTTISNANDEWSIAGVVKVGGETLPGTNPFAAMTSTNTRFYHYQLNSTLENIVPTKVRFRVRRLGSAASATVICRIRDTANNVLYTYPQTISFNTISTSVQDIEFSDVNQTTVQLADGYRIGIEYGVVTGINTSTVYLEVNYNSGSGSGAFEGTAWKAQYYRTLAPVGWVDYPNADWAGKIWIGGSSFTSYVEFTPTIIDITEKVNAANPPTNPPSKLIGKKHTKLTATLKKSGSPSGPIYVKIWGADGSDKFVFNTVLEASSLSTSDSTYVFTGVLNNYVAALNDRIGLQYFGATATDKVLVKINTDTAAGAPADGTKSILSTFNTTVGTWQDSPSLDLAVEIFTGGVPDLTSRTKAAIRCDSIFSILDRKKITRAIIPLKKVGAPTGNYFIRSVRGSDGANRDLLGSGDIASLSTSTWTLKDVSNYTATHFLGESDKIIVEYEGGDGSNGLVVQVKQDSTYDDADTRYEDFNSVTWSTVGYDTWDMGATLYIGGDTYIPDAGTPYVEPPDYYDHDWLIGTGAFVKGVHDSFYGMRIRDFKIETSVPTLEQIDTLYDNKYSRRGGKGEVALSGYCTYDTQTEPPP